MNNILKKLNLRYYIFIFIIFFTAGSLHARYLPSNFPIHYEWTGKVQAVTKNSIFVNDRAFKLTSGISFHSTDSYNNTINDIEIGMTVGCVTDESGSLISIWQFPNNLGNITGVWSDDGKDDLD